VTDGTADLPPTAPTGRSAWRNTLGQWQHRWRLPDTFELRDANRMLRLDLTEPAHTAILRAHLDRSGHAVLTIGTARAEAVRRMS